jgi:CHAT domain-containing protein
MHEPEAIEIIHTLRHRGAYADAATFAASLDPALRTRPAVALAQMRVRMLQGRVNEAHATLAEADLDAATPGERLILALEQAALHIFRDIAVRKSLEAAEAAFIESAGAAIDPADRAEAERVHIRILLIASVYHEISLEVKKAARNQLPGLATSLEKAGRIDESLAARLTHAEQADTPAERLETLETLAERAMVLNRPDFAGEIHVARAEQMRAAGAPNAAIHAELDMASALFSAVEHVYGPIDVHRVRAWLSVEREYAPLDELQTCLEAYRRIDYPSRMINLMLDLAQLMHERGDTSSAIGYRKQCLELANVTGMGLLHDSLWTAQVDLFMRNANYSSAIELCQTALASDLPSFSIASYEQLLATAYSFVGNLSLAQKHMQIAIAGFESIGASDSASVAVLKYASDLDSTRRDKDWDAAVSLLDDWIARDEQREDYAGAAGKQELLAQIDLNHFNFSPTRRGEPALLATVEKTIEAAEKNARKLSGLESVRRLGALQQLRGQLAQARGDSEAVEQAWRNAQAIYEAAKLGMEVANCRYIIGALRLNRANQELMPHFGEAECNFREALTYYIEAGMRERASDTRFMLARLYTNASAALGVPAELGEQMLDAAIGHLEDAEADCDSVRREFGAGSILEVQHAKRTLAERSHRIYDLGLSILVSKRRSVDAWQWCQRAKARALGDALGISSAPPLRVLAELEIYPESLALIHKERELVDRIDKVSAADRLTLRSELVELRNQMAKEPRLAEYLELRQGDAIDPDDIAALLKPEIASGPACVCVDWAMVGERLVLLTLRPDEEPQIAPLAIRVSEVRAFIAECLSPPYFRQTLLDAPELLRKLDSLIAPLAELSEPEELLILSPTGPLHALPLHALEIEKTALIRRNPVVYSPSLSILRHCLARRGLHHDKRSISLFGDPTRDRLEAAELVTYLAQRFGTTPLLGEQVIRRAFIEQLSKADFIHFQGHAKHDNQDPLNSHLILADSHFTAADIFGLRELRAEMIVLGACESAASVIATGDEPLGIIPAFLFAGAGAVLAALWPVHKSSATEIMRTFYDTILDGDTLNKAEALRKVATMMADSDDFFQPYHWAPYVLYGDWR